MRVEPLPRFKHPHASRSIRSAKLEPVGLDLSMQKKGKFGRSSGGLRPASSAGCSLRYCVLGARAQRQTKTDHAAHTRWSHSKGVWYISSEPHGCPSARDSSGAQSMLQVGFPCLLRCHLAAKGCAQQLRLASLKPAAQTLHFVHRCPLERVRSTTHHKKRLWSVKLSPGHTPGSTASC